MMTTPLPAPDTATPAVAPNAVPARARRNTRSDATRARMLDAAERLMAHDGINGVSLRQISVASGLANNAGLQYHFGTKTALITAIMRRRAESFEPQRRELLAKAPRSGRMAVARAMLAVLFAPIAGAVDDKGMHVYAAFLMQLGGLTLSEPDYELPAFAPGSPGTVATQRLMALRPELPIAAAAARLVQVGTLMYAALLERDRQHVRGLPVVDENSFLDDVLGMMAAAWLAPLSSA